MKSVCIGSAAGPGVAGAGSEVAVEQLPELLARLEVRDALGRHLDLVAGLGVAPGAGSAVPGEFLTRWVMNELRCALSSALAAWRAILVRSSAVILLSRARPPLRPSATAAGSLRFIRGYIC